MVRLALIALVLGGVFGGAAVVGDAVAPIETQATGVVDREGGDDSATPALRNETRSEVTPPPASGHAGHGEGSAGADSSAAGGVLISNDGYQLEPDATTLSGGPGTPFSFRIIGPDGAPVQEFDLFHERELHLVVVGRDLTSYEHVHPTRAADGTWSTDLPALPPGSYRAFADFVVADGPALTLSVDLLVPGAVAMAATPEPRTVDYIDGYVVTFAGEAAAGTLTDAAVTVERDGASVTDLEPYLGEAGHLVAVRSGDLAYVHVHPVDAGQASSGPTVPFAFEPPSAGTYRLFFEFAHQGEVRTADFTVDVAPPAEGGDGAPESGDDGPKDSANEEVDEEHEHHGLGGQVAQETTNEEGA
jgi:hypothetical protein